MNPYLKELENFSYPLHRDDLYADNDEEFIKINYRNKVEAKRIQRNVEKLKIEKIDLEKSWNSFVSNLKDYEGFTRVTDRSIGAYTHSFKMEILLPGNLGIGFCISQIVNLIGIYFTSQNLKSSIPLKQYSSAIGIFSKESTNPFISYFPYSEEQLEVANKLIENCEDYFPNFQLFNSLFANTKIKDLVIEEKMVFESDLFQVLFANNLVVI